MASPVVGQKGDPICARCRYPLASLAEDVPCPECGSSLRVPKGQNPDRTVARVFYWVSVCLLAPSWLPLSLSAAGWVIAHRVLGIPVGTRIQNGAEPVFDVLGDLVLYAWVLTILPGLLGLLSSPCTVVLLAISEGLEKRGRRSVVLAVSAVPMLMCLPGLFGIRVFGSLGGWVPD